VTGSGYLGFMTGENGVVLQGWNVVSAGVPHSLVGVGGVSASSVIAIGNKEPGKGKGIAFHYDGSSWTTKLVTANFNDIWVADASHAYTACWVNGINLCHDGTSWAYCYSGLNGTTFHDVHGVSNNDLTFVGGQIMHCSGSTCAALNIPGGGALYGVWNTGWGDIFAVGKDGAIVYYDGTSWKIQQTQSTSHPALNAIWGASPTDVYTVGDSGTMLHYNGSAWSTIPPVTSKNLHGIWGASGTAIYAVGDSGVVLTTMAHPGPRRPAGVGCWSPSSHGSRPSPGHR